MLFGPRARRQKGGLGVLTIYNQLVNSKRFATTIVKNSRSRCRDGKSFATTEITPQSGETAKYRAIMMRRYENSDKRAGPTCASAETESVFSRISIGFLIEDFACTAEAKEYRHGVSWQLSLPNAPRAHSVLAALSTLGAIMRLRSWRVRV